MLKKLILLVVTVFFAAVNSFGLTVQLEAVQNDLVAQRYKAAKDNLRMVLSQNPTDIEALYLQLAVCQTEILDYESYNTDGKRFIATADSVKEIIEKRMTLLHGKDSVMCLFYLANVYGGISVMQAKTGEWLDGAKNGMASVELLRQVQKAEPDFLAANLGVGLFNYYFGSSLNWLPFSGRRVNEGLCDIEAATQSEFPFNYAAKNSLCWILIDKQEYTRADSVAVSVLNSYPNNTIFLRIRSIIDLRSGAYKNAIEHANQLLQLTKERAPRNWSDLVAAYYILVESYSLNGQVSESLVAADTILGQNIPQAYLSVPHIKKNLKRIRDIKEKMCEK